MYIRSDVLTTSGHRKFVPRGEKRQDAERGQRRVADWQHDAEENAQLAGAVDPRGFDQIVRNAEHELAHQEHAEGGCREGQDERRVAVDQSQRAHQHEQRHQRDRAWHHQRRHYQQEDLTTTNEVQLGEGVARVTAAAIRADTNTRSPTG